MDTRDGGAHDDAWVARFTAARLRGDPLSPEQFLAANGDAPRSLAARLAEVDAIFRAAEAYSQETPERGDDWIPDVGAELGGFRILRRIGQGGMGIVFEAQERSGRRVALKVLTPELRSSKEAVARFQREARIAAALSHPRCVFVYGVHELDGLLAISMELVSGATLQDTLDSGARLTIEKAVRWTLEILEGLEAAHRAGIVHRDLKPANCFVTASGSVKVGDFGLSRLVERNLRLTATGRFIGSPLYAAPEQLLGHELDGRADIYAAGATLYALLTGEPPHTADDLGELIARILSEPATPPRERRAQIPQRLQDVVLRALSKDPAKRFATASEFAAALQPFVATKLQPASRGARFLAYSVDACVVLVPTAVVTIRFPWLSDHISSMLGELLALMLSSAYFIVLEAKYGATLGKWLLGLRVVSASGHPASAGAVAIRAVVLFAPTQLVEWVTDGLTGPAVMGAISVNNFAAATLAAGFLTMRRSNGWRAVHEFASGTRVVRASESVLGADLVHGADSSPQPIEPTPIESVRLGDYLAVGELGRSAHGRVLLARDERLNRDVWLHERALSNAASRAIEAQQASAIEGVHARRIAHFELGDASFDVLEAIAGEPLLAFAQRTGRMRWTHARAILADLAAILAEQPEALAPSRLWIDVDHKLRIAAVALGAELERELEPGELLALCARSLLQPVGERGTETFPGVPTHAVRAARRACAGPADVLGMRWVATALKDSLSTPAAVTRRMRLSQLTPTVVFGGLLMLSLVLGTASAELHEQLDRHSAAQVQWLERRDDIEEREWRADFEARELLIAALTTSGAVEGSDEHLELQRAARAAHPAPDRTDVARARTHLLARAERLREYGLPPEPIGVDEWEVALRSLCEAWIVVAGLSIVSAFAWRGGLGVKFASLHVLDRAGAPASSLRCALRTLIAVAVPLVLCVLGLALARGGNTPMGWLCACGAIAVCTFGVVNALLRPATSWYDSLSGTHVVPR